MCRHEGHPGKHAATPPAPPLGEKCSAGFSFAGVPADLRGWVAFTRHTSSLLPKDLGNSISTMIEGTEQGKREKGSTPPYPIHFRPTTSLLLTKTYLCSKHPALATQPCSTQVAQQPPAVLSGSQLPAAWDRVLALSSLFPEGLPRLRHSQASLKHSRMLAAARLA